MNELESLGVNRLHDEIKAGRDVLPLLRDLLRDFGTANIGLFAGAVTGALALIRSAESSGITFDLHGQSMAASSALAVEFTRTFAERDLMKVCELTKIVAGSIDGLRAKGVISFDPPADKEEKEAGPLRVEIVSMPARETTTAIKRDGTGAITESTQLEKDVVTPEVA